MATFRTYAKVLEPDDAPARICEAGISTCPGGPGRLLADVLARTGAELAYEGDEGRRVGPDSESAVATILPDGTVVPGAWHPGRAADRDLCGSIIRKTTYVARTRTCNVSVNVVIKP